MNDKIRYRYLGLWWFIGIIMILSVVYLSLTSNPTVVIDYPFIDKLEHMLAYAMLMGWFCQLITARSSRIILAILFCLMGVSLELLQGMGGYRVFEYSDMTANTVGVFFGWWVSSRLFNGWLARIDRTLSA